MRGWVGAKAKGIGEGGEYTDDITRQNCAGADISQQGFFAASPKSIENAVRADGKQPDTNQNDNDLGETDVKTAVKVEKVGSQPDDENNKTDHQRGEPTAKQCVRKAIILDAVKVVAWVDQNIAVAKLHKNLQVSKF